MLLCQGLSLYKKMVRFYWKNNIKLNFDNFYENPMIPPDTDCGKNLTLVKDVCKKWKNVSQTYRI